MSDKANPLATYHQRQITDQAQPVTIYGLSGSNGEKDLRGLHTNRPAANSLPVGSTYWSVDEPSAPGTVFVTDGADWTVLTDLSE